MVCQPTSAGVSRQFGECLERDQRPGRWTPREFHNTRPYLRSECLPLPVGRQMQSVPDQWPQPRRRTRGIIARNEKYPEKPALGKDLETQLKIRRWKRPKI